MGMKGAIVVNLGRCQGCKTCELACAVEHSQSKRLEESVLETPAPRSRVSVEQGDGYAVPLQCRQCENAPCVAVCPTRALHRTNQESPVLIDHDLCVGCQACVLACPFGVIRMDRFSRAIIKCDQCFERVQRGEQPACVASCPVRALEFKSLDEVTREKRGAYLLQIERATDGI
jgi:anaerobic carbon-monoxide dehydrogenase iron sulfur subunit